MDFEMLESIINKINRPLIFQEDSQNCLKLKLKEYPVLAYQ